MIKENPKFTSTPTFKVIQHFVPFIRLLKCNAYSISQLKKVTGT